MSQEIDGDTLTLLIMIAVIYWQLGRSIGRAPPHDTDTARKAGDGAVLALGKQAAGPVNPQGGAEDDVRWKGIAEPGSVLARDLSAVQMADRSFEAHRFLDGAASAYETIVSAFAGGERSVLEDLLSPDVYGAFAAAIAERERRGEHMELSFVSVNTPQIVEAELYANSAQVTVRFISEQVTAIRAAGNAVISGDPREVVKVVETWIFAREISSSQSNWKLIATDTG